jgi:hypothetical protein
MVAVHPNFFVVGCARSGSTTLVEALRHHPDVGFSAYKEPHYYGRDLVRGSQIDHLDRAAYLRLFRQAAGKKRIGDGSIYTILSDSAAEEIYADYPEAYILLMLRNPVDSIYSLNRRILFQEPLEHALAMEDERRQRAPGWSLRDNLPLYIEQLLYYRHNILVLPERIRRFQEVFGRKRVGIFFFEDLCSTPDIWYREILRFLELADRPMPPIAPQDPSMAWRYPGLAPWVGRAVALYNRAGLGMFLPLWRAKKWGKRWIKRPLDGEAREELAPEIRQQLQREFGGAITELSALSDRDLSHWL